jgi:hypothetical protein
MTSTARNGFTRQVLRTVLALFVIGSVVGFIWAFDLQRNADDGFEAPIVTLQCWLAYLGTVVAGVLLVPLWRWGCEKASLRVPLIAWGLLLAGVPTGGLLGARQRHRDVADSRAQAQESVAALKEHLATAGEYPVSLKEAGAERALPGRAGRLGLTYTRTAPDRFVLEYSFGWSFHVYDSIDGGWDVRD